MLQSAFGFGGNGESEEAPPDLWDPDSTGHGTANGFGKKEWNLLVVNDKKVVNAMAAPGEFLKLYMHPGAYRSQARSLFSLAFSLLRKMSKG